MRLRCLKSVPLDVPEVTKKLYGSPNCRKSKIHIRCHTFLSSLHLAPPPHSSRSQYQLVKSRNMQELLKKGIAMSSPPERHSMLSSSAALSPGGRSSGFGSINSTPGNGTSASNASSSAQNQVVITAGAGGSVRKSIGYQSAVESSQLSRLSSSAPTHLDREHIWMRREPRQHLLSTGSLAEAESFSSLSTGSVLSPDGIDFSQDDDDDASSDNSDNYDDFSSDNGEYPLMTWQTKHNQEIIFKQISVSFSAFKIEFFLVIVHILQFNSLVKILTNPFIIINYLFIINY